MKIIRMYVYIYKEICAGFPVHLCLIIHTRCPDVPIFKSTIQSIFYWTQQTFSCNLQSTVPLAPCIPAFFRWVASYLESVTTYLFFLRSPLVLPEFGIAWWNIAYDCSNSVFSILPVSKISSWARYDVKSDEINWRRL